MDASHREPVEVDEVGGDVLPEFSASEKPWQQSSARTGNCPGFYWTPHRTLVQYSSWNIMRAWTSLQQNQTVRGGDAKCFEMVESRLGDEPDMKNGMEGIVSYLIFRRVGSLFDIKL